MTSDNTAVVLETIGESIEDATEESFLLFSQDLPHNDLGIIDDKADEISVEVNGHEYSIVQSSGLLRSRRAAGTTGAMVWKVTPRLAQWLASDDNILWRRGILNSSSNIVELGCGVAGIIGLVLAAKVNSYVLTDQAYVLKLLTENLSRNRQQSAKESRHSKKRSNTPRSTSDNLHVMPFDWEHDSAQNFNEVLSLESNIDVIIICDCVYNSFLIEPLSQACVDLCQLRPAHPTVVLIAQQLRTDEVFEEWLTRFLKNFRVWRVKDEVLPLELRSSSGYVVHAALLQND